MGGLCFYFSLFVSRLSQRVQNVFAKIVQQLSFWQEKTDFTLKGIADILGNKLILFYLHLPHACKDKEDKFFCCAVQNEELTKGII